MNLLLPGTSQADSQTRVRPTCSVWTLCNAFLDNAMYPIMFVDYVTAFRRGLAASASDGSLSAGDGDSGSALQLAVGPQLPDIAAMPLDSQVIDGSGGGGGGGGGLLDDSFASDSFGGGGAGGEEEEEDAFTRWLIGTSNTNCTQAQRTSGAPLAQCVGFT